MLMDTDRIDEADCLDALDRRIVAALQISPRAGVAEVARILGEHERAVARRVQRLLDTGVTHCTAEFGPLLRGRGHPLHLRLKRAAGWPESASTALAAWAEVLNVDAVAGGTGRLWCELLVETRSALYTATADGLPGLPDVDVLGADFTLRTFRDESEWYVPVLTEEEEKRLRASLVQPLPGPAQPYNLTPGDVQVVEALKRNARVSLTELAGELGFSTATAGRRITALLERRALRLRTVVDPTLLGRPVRARVRLKVHPAGLEAVGGALSACPDVLFCAAVTGQYNLLVDVCVEDEGNLYRFVVDTLGVLPHISDVGTEIVRRLPLKNGTPT
ncbi:Lrp/AsnC family transcriptional regulator [Streptomyces sp. NPDC059631]|uniref:Lrp/AsnC family transcriptional regulator n=1 Tax=unclassified Streptomyces TaxID=2593676 RepID=UPI0036A40DEF